MALMTSLVKQLTNGEAALALDIYIEAGVSFLFFLIGQIVQLKLKAVVINSSTKVREYDDVFNCSEFMTFNRRIYDISS